MANKEPNTRSFILRIDSDIMEALEKWAADEFRSTNGQLQWIIAEALRRSGRKPRTERKRTKANMEGDKPANESNEQE